MGKFLRDNWFRSGLLLIGLLIALSISYYYVIFLPQKEIEKINLLKSEQEAKSLREFEVQNQEDLKSQQLEDCLESAKQSYETDRENYYETHNTSAASGWHESPVVVAHYEEIFRIDLDREYDSCYKRFPLRISK